MIPFKSCHDHVIHHGTRIKTGPITLKDTTFPLSINFHKLVRQHCWVPGIETHESMRNFLH